MTYEQYRNCTHEIVNEVNDLCATAVITDRMTLDEVVSYFTARLAKISDVCIYPEDA